MVVPLTERLNKKKRTLSMDARDNNNNNYDDNVDEKLNTKIVYKRYFV